jgi:NmrA-like family
VRPNQSGELELTLPVGADSKIALFSVAETGNVVSKVLDEKEKYLGKRIAMVGDYLTPNEISATLAKRIFSLRNNITF